MEITHVITSMDSGGAEKMLYRLIKYSDKTIKHKIIVLNKVGFYHEELLDYDIQTLELNLNKNIYKPWKLIKNLRKIKNFISSSNIINSWMYHSNILGFLIGKIYNKPIIWNIRRSYVSRDKMKYLTSLILKLNMIISKKVKIVIYNSQEGKLTHKELGFQETKSVYISNGFEVANRIQRDYSFDKGYIKLLNVARWEKLKDHKTLLEGVALFKKNNPGLKFDLTLCGKNIDKNNEELMELITSNGLLDNVVLLGERKDIDYIMSNSDIYISSSYSEGFPNVVAEAMLNGMICIGTNVGETSNIINDKKFIFEKGNSSEIARLINLLLELNENEIKLLRENNINRIINNFSIENIVRKYELVFKEEF